MFTTSLFLIISCYSQIYTTLFPNKNINNYNSLIYFWIYQLMSFLFLFISLTPLRTVLSGKRRVNVFELHFSIDWFEIVKVFCFPTHCRLQLFFLLFPHFFQRNEIHLWYCRYVRLTEIVNAWMPVYNEWLINALIVIFSYSYLCCWIVGVLPHLHQQVHCEDLFRRKTCRIPVMPVVEWIVFIFEISGGKNHFSCC